MNKKIIRDFLYRIAEIVEISDASESILRRLKK